MWGTKIGNLIHSVTRISDGRGRTRSETSSNTQRTSHIRKKPKIREKDSILMRFFSVIALILFTDLCDQLAQALGHFDKFGAVDHANVPGLRDVDGFV